MLLERYDVTRMRRCRGFLLAILVMSLVPAFGAQPSFVVHGPTVVAFFPPVQQKELETDADTNEALADFQEYTRRVRDPFRKEGVDFHEVYALTFRIRVGSKVTIFHAGDVKVGYYFVAPGKKPRIHYGVETDIDLLQIDADYFGLVNK